MRRILLVTICLFSFSHALLAGEAPVVEGYLHSGKLLAGEQELEAILRNSPGDDQARFGLGFLRAVRAIERFGQKMYEYGAKSEIDPARFIRLPIPHNPDPATINYFRFRRMLEDLRLDLLRTEETLAKVADDRVKLPLHVAEIRVDLDGDGVASDEFLSLLKVMWRTEIPFLKENPRFKICFDRGDVAWLRAYCHSLMALCDVSLAMEGRAWFDSQAERVFGKVSKASSVDPSTDTAELYEPRRLARFQLHVIAICELNRETWRFIRAETDNDFEWLPSAKQRGVLGLPIRDEMVDSWLAALDDIEQVFRGKLAFPMVRDELGNKLNLAAILDEPPMSIKWREAWKRFPENYISTQPECCLDRLFRAWGMFSRPEMSGYMFWFN
jgi:hypothetical protein